MSAHKQLLPISLSLFVILLFPVILLSVSASSSHTTKETLGIPPQDEMYFKSAIIKCRDGSKKFSKEQLNDDFCDCPDGTDEPGTSACPEGRFYCRNAGHIPLTLFSSRVNDGICDCCDGSDEYDGKVKCQNTCWEAGKAARDKLKKKIATYQDGVAIRKKEVEQAKETIAKAETELVKLKSEEKILKGLVQQLKDRKEQIEKVEEQERREKEKEEQKHREAEEKGHEDEQQAPVDIADENSQHGEEKLPDSPNEVAEEIGESVSETRHNNPAGNEAAPVHVEEGDVDTSVGDEDAHDAMSGGPHHSEEEKEGSQLSKEELGRLVASRWTGENTQEQQQETVAKEAELHETDDRTNEVEQHDTNPEDDYDGYSSETDEENIKYGDDDSHDNDDAYNDENEDPLASYSPDEDKPDFSDISAPSSSSWLDKIQETVKTVLQAVNLFKTPVDKSEAAQVRKEYDESSAKLSKLQSRISTLTKKLANDYGPEKEFYSFYDHCFENKENKYVYKVCPFKEASQVEGYSTTRLGRWENFEDSYRVMLFLHGDKCWNGPDRSLKVKLRCGIKNELADVDEPSRCEYVALLSTPAVCLEERLKELQHKLDLMNKELPQSHDEL